MTKTYPASHDYGLYLWEFDGKWFWAIPTHGIASLGFGFGSHDEARENATRNHGIKLEPNEGLVYRELVAVDPEGF